MVDGILKGKKDKHKVYNKQVSFTSEVKLVKTKKVSENQTLKSRGLNMVEDKEIRATPVQIELNLDNTVTEYNIIDSLTEFFSRMAIQDLGMRILNN